MVRLVHHKIGSGRLASARFLLAGLIAAAAPAFAQPAAQPRQPAPQQAISAPNAAVPDPLIVAKLVWSSMAALDHANQTGNYSVLRDLGAPGFQSNNSDASLGSSFQALRERRVDLGNTLVVAPSYETPPAFVQEGLLRIRGSFPLRPVAIGFDLLFQNVGGQWKIFGIAAAPLAPQSPQTPSTRR